MSRKALFSGAFKPEPYVLLSLFLTLGTVLKLHNRTPAIMSDFPATENGKLSLKGRVAIVTGAGNGLGRA